jgi:hypothetical protein
VYRGKARTLGFMLAAAWLTAAATALLALFAVVTAWYARKAFREQSRELALLQQQADAQQAELLRQADDRRRAQAIGVYVTGAPRTHPHANAARSGAQASMVDAVVYNTSAQPVYSVKIHWINLDSATQLGDVDRLGTIAPGGHRSASRPAPDGLNPYRFSPVISFRDAAAERWTMTRGGYLAPVDPALPEGAPEVGERAVRESPFWDIGLSVATWGPVVAPGSRPPKRGDDAAAS